MHRCLVFIMVILLAGCAAPRAGSPGTPSIPAPAGGETGFDSPEEAIRAIQAQYPQVAKIEPILTPVPFGSDRVIVLEDGDGWKIIFHHGEGDCPAGCLNNYYYYFRANPNGEIVAEGQYSLERGKGQNIVETGAPLWGVPR